MLKFLNGVLISIVLLSTSMSVSAETNLSPQNSIIEPHAIYERFSVKYASWYHYDYEIRMFADGRKVCSWIGSKYTGQPRYGYYQTSNPYYFPSYCPGRP